MTVTVAKGDVTMRCRAGAFRALGECFRYVPIEARAPTVLAAMMPRAEHLHKKEPSCAATKRGTDRGRAAI